MNFRTTAILFGIVFALGVVLLALSLMEEDKAPSGELVLAGLAGVKPEEVDTVELDRGGSRLVMKRTGKDNWEITEPITTRADAAAVDRVIGALLGARATTYPELSANPAVHGLDNPGLRVTLRAGDKSDTLNVGDVTIGGSKAVGFVTTPTRKRPMAVSRADLEPLFREAKAGKAGDLAKWTNDYRVKQVFAVDTRTAAEDLTGIKVSVPNKKQEVALSRSAGGWKFDTPPGWGDAAVTGDTGTAGSAAITGVRGLVNAVVNLQAASADDFIDSPKDLKEYGLNPDNPDRIRVEIKPKDGPAEVAFIGKKQEPAPAAPPGGAQPPAPPAKVYVQREGSNAVVHVGASADTINNLAALAANPDPLRDRDLVKDTDRSRIDAIDIATGGQTTKLRKAPGSAEWKLYGGPNDPQTANQDAVKKLLDLLTHPHVVKDFPPANDANFTPAETKAEVKLWADAIKANPDPKADPKAEPKVEGPPTVLVFGKTDPEGINVRRTLASGAKTDVRLPAKVKVGGAVAPFGGPSPSEEVDVAAAVKKTRLDFLDPSLKPFSPFQVDRLVIQNGANVTEVVREKSTGTPGEEKWKFVKPDPRKDRPVDADTMTQLLPMLPQKADRFLAETPSEADLVKWGLDPKGPRLKVTLGLDTGPPPVGGAPPANADKERVYSFGNPTADGNSVYARVEGKAAVFAAPKAVFERFSTADLRDKTVVRFDRAKVKQVRLRGWKEKTGFEVALTFDRKDGTWVVAKAPGKYDLDPAKVDKFLDAVNGLRAKAFVAGPPKPEYKLTPEANGLEVVIGLEGSPAITLFVGAPTDGDTSLYVQTSTLPAGENVVTVAADVFKGYKAESGSFAK